MCLHTFWTCNLLQNRASYTDTIDLDFHCQGLSSIELVAFDMAAPITAIIIGAGPAGIAMGYHLKRKLRTNDFAIFDQNPEAGGTWYSNSYPGCGTAVSIESILNSI